MFKPVQEMTNAELRKEYNAILQYEKVIDDISVENILEKKHDLSFLEVLNCTLTPNKQLFRKDFQGFLPKMLEGMYNDRKKYKKMMLDAEQEYELASTPSEKEELKRKISRYKNLQLAKKLGLNSAYGAMGSKYFRFYDLRLALAVTQTGKTSIKWIEKKINEYLNSVLNTKNADYIIASDTDSVYINLDGIVNHGIGENKNVQEVISFMDIVCEKRLKPYIDRSYKELADYIGAYAQKMSMKREALADVGIWTAKKRYVLNVYNSEGVAYIEPHVKVCGLEMVRSSTPMVVRDKMEKILPVILNKTESDVQKFIKDFKTEFKKLNAEDIAFPRGVNNLAQYSSDTSIYTGGTPIHVKGSLLYNFFLKELKLTDKYGNIQEGEKIKFVYLKKPNPRKCEVISFPSRIPKEFGLEEYIDYNKQFEKTFLDPISNILECIGWKAEKVNTLDKFFT